MDRRALIAAEEEEDEDAIFDSIVDVALDIVGVVVASRLGEARVVVLVDEVDFLNLRG